MIIEITRFKTKSSVTYEQLISADHEFNEALKAMGGLLHRELLAVHEKPQEWLDIMHWRTLDDAKHSARNIGGHPKAGPFFALLEKSDNEMIYAQRAAQYGNV